MTTALPALSDIAEDVIPGVLRIENSDREATTPVIMDMLRSVYPHDQVFGPYCPVQAYIAAPPRDVFDYLADTRSLEEWTYSLRGFTPTETPELWQSFDRLGDQTKCFAKTVFNADAMTVDYHCAWDQGEHLWMIYLMRVVDAQVVLNKPGSVVLWNNVHHPFYDENPYPETAPANRPVWVGDFWDMFSAGHQLEMNNLKAICEYRASHGLPIKPDWMN
ncbi:SRPBCC family protein [Antrihabitans cavernicola]|uniref:SRPBCC family protein n=1 Tax=Antrihabitans cavernicola TaxID=2495913 RepID=A0A5A7SFT0_9NOCA|nr:SRPBCC family protein [Spelaeibacter cavernicola]KAA0024998.1 SRPBCC family protein [Spelaeibacter cavernicola]